MLLTATVVTLSLVSFLAGSFVLVRNYEDSVNRSFAFFAYITSVWMLANYIGANFKAHLYAKYFIYADFIVGPFFTYSFWWLTRGFLLQTRPRSARTQRYVAAGFLMLVILAALSISSKQFVLVKTVNNQIDITYGPYFDLYSSVTILGVILAFYNLITAFKSTSGRLKAQIQTMLVGLVMLSIALAFANLIVPQITDSKSINLLAGNLAYIGIVAFEVAAFYAIVRHRLFDIRLALTRTIGFLATVITVAALYSLLVIGIGAPLITNGKITLVKNNLQLLLLVPPTIFIALTFHSLQQYIARLTRRIFYQDAYELRDVLDTLSDTLITENNIDEIMKRSLQVISDAIKPSHAYFVLLDDKAHPYHQLQVNRSSIQNLDWYIELIRHHADRLLVKDELSSGKRQQELEKEGLSLLLRLGTAKDLTGVIFFGPKQSGRIYTQQDIDLLNVGSKNLGIAIENAKKYEQISQFADTLSQEVLRATARLRKANEELKTLDALKDDFISMASHQLRTPATSVHGAIQMLREGSFKPAERKQLIELAEASSERLVSVVVDMLSIARIQAGHFNIDKEEINLVELADRAIKEALMLAQQKKIKLVFDKPKQPIKLSVDRAKINETMSNYIENAIKYSQENSSINVGLKKAGNQVIFEVADQGIGVPAAERKNLFGKFYRAKNAREEQPDGNGIGLFVVKTIIEAHNGQAYYKPLEKGSLFGFWLPAGTPTS